MSRHSLDTHIGKIIYSRKILLISKFYEKTYLLDAQFAMLAKSLLRVKGLSEEVMHKRLFNWLLLTVGEVCMGESWLRSPLQTECSEVCTSDWGQDSPIQTNLARLIRCLLYGQTRKQRNKNINNFICFPARAQAFSWLSSVTGLQSKRDKNNCSKSSLLYKLCTNKPIFSYSLFVTFWGQLLQQDQSRCRSRWENLDRGQDRF